MVYLLDLVSQSVARRARSAALSNTQALVRGVATSHTTFDPSNPMLSPLENPAMHDYRVLDKCQNSPSS